MEEVGKWLTEVTYPFRKYGRRCPDGNRSSIVVGTRIA